MQKEEEQFIDIISRASRKEINLFLKEFTSFNGPLSEEAAAETKKILDSRPEKDPDPIIVRLGEYIGISDRYAQFKVLKNGRIIYHTSTMIIAPKNEEECLSVLKEVLENTHTLFPVRSYVKI